MNILLLSLFILCGSNNVAEDTIFSDCPYVEFDALNNIFHEDTVLYTIPRTKIVYVPRNQLDETDTIFVPQLIIKYRGREFKIMLELIK